MSRLTATLTATFTAGIIAGLTVASPVIAKEYVYGSWFGVNHPANTIGLAPYFEAVEKETNGSVAWKLVPGAQLANGPGTPEAVGSGLMDGGMVMAPYQPSMLPTTNLIFSHSLPGSDSLAATGAMNEALMLNCPGCQAEFAANDAVGFAGYSTTPYKFMCRGEPRTLADLKGLKIRGSGGGVNIIEIAGATPVSMPPSDATSALERGTLDCVLGAVPWLKSYGYIDVAKTVIDSPMGMGGPPVMMYLNRDAWESMSPEDRAAQIRLAPMLVAGATIDGQTEIEADVVSEAKERGIVFVEDSAEFQTVMTARDEQQRDINISNAENAGAKDGAAVLDAYLVAYEKWKKLIEENGSDRATFEKLLWDEVYSKVDPEAI